MKKLLFVFFAAILFTACSSDEEVQMKMTFNSQVLETVEGVETGKYYKSNDPGANQLRYVIYIPYLGPTNKALLACDGFCPNTKTKHKNDIFIRMNEGNYYCPQCGARYNVNGTPANKEAEGTALLVYKISYDPKKDMYRVWTE